jgi:2-polyprenyl-3-methyl-5-hydroxy-6-metoxy-1,4-benzoquinol methylase
VDEGITELSYFDDDYWLSHEDYLTTEQAEADLGEVLRLIGSTSGRLLDAPCGTGRLSARLAQLGFEVDGLDADPRALDLARRQQRGFSRAVNYVERDLRNLNGLGPYDVIISWFNSLGYFTTEENDEVITSLTSLLRPGGFLLINTLDLDVVRDILQRGPLEEVVVVRGRTITSTAQIHGRRLVTRRCGSGVGAEVERTASVELHTSAEWVERLSRSGFADVAVEQRVEPSLGDPVAEITVRGVR